MKKTFSDFFHYSAVVGHIQHKNWYFSSVPVGVTVQYQKSSRALVLHQLHLSGDGLAMVSIMDPQKIQTESFSPLLKLNATDGFATENPSLPFYDCLIPRNEETARAGFAFWQQLKPCQQLVSGVAAVRTSHHPGLGRGGVVAKSFSAWPASQEEGGYWKWKECDG